jgi:hypothetical protein
MFGHGGLLSVNQGFHSGYAGWGPYIGNGGGHFGGRGRPTGWTAQLRGGFGGCRGPMVGSSGDRLMVNGNREAVELRKGQSAFGANRELQVSSWGRTGQDQCKEKDADRDSGGRSGAAGSVSVGGKYFNFLEQTVVLLQQAFEAISKAKSDSINQLADSLAKGWVAITTEPVEESSKHLLIQDGVESS